MEKELDKSNARDAERAAIVQKTARICGVSERYVRMVMSGERENDTVVETYMEIQESLISLENNLLVKAAEKAVPLN